MHRGEARQRCEPGPDLQVDRWTVAAPPSEDALIAAALQHTDGHQGVAAGLLGVSCQTLHKCPRRCQPSPDLLHA